MEKIWLPLFFSKISKTQQTLFYNGEGGDGGGLQLCFSFFKLRK